MLLGVRPSGCSPHTGLSWGASVFPVRNQEVQPQTKYREPHNLKCRLFQSERGSPSTPAVHCTGRQEVKRSGDYNHTYLSAPFSVPSSSPVRLAPAQVGFFFMFVWTGTWLCTHHTWSSNSVTQVWRMGVGEGEERHSENPQLLFLKSPTLQPGRFQ